MSDAGHSHDRVRRRLAAQPVDPAPEFADALREHLESLQAEPEAARGHQARTAALYGLVGAALLVLPAAGALGIGPFAS